MQKLKFAFLAPVLFTLAATCIPAQKAVSPEKVVLIKEFLEVTGGNDSALKMADAMVAFQEVESTRMIESMIDGDKKLSVAEKAKAKKMATDSFGRLTTRVREFYATEIKFDQIIEEIVTPVYDKNFSESELRELVAFYRTPIGQKTIQIAPQLMIQSISGVSEKIMPKLQEFIKKATEDEFARLKRQLQ